MQSETSVIRCVWSGGGYSIWELEVAGQRVFRLGRTGGKTRDFATEAEATAAMAADQLAE